MRRSASRFLAAARAFRTLRAWSMRPWSASSLWTAAHRHKRRHVALDKVELREQRSLARKARRARRIAEGQRRAVMAALAEKRRRQNAHYTDPRLLEDGALAREFWRKAQSPQTGQAGEKEGAQDAAPTDRKLLREGAVSREFWKKSRVEGQAESKGEGSSTSRGPRRRRRPKGYGYRRGEE